MSRASDSQRIVVSLDIKFKNIIKTKFQTITKGLFGGNLELYPVYNPQLHMPVLALAPGQIG